MSSEDAGFGALPLATILQKVSAREPVPGGGAVAGMVTALGAALGGMVVAYSIGRKSLEDDQAMLAAAASELEELRDRASKQADDDARAYEQLNALWSLDKEDPLRKASFNDALLGAIDAPGSIMQTASGIMELLGRLPGHSARTLASDLAIAVELTATGARAAERNVAVNLPFLEDEAQRAGLDEKYGALGAGIDQAARDILAVIG